MFKNEIRRVIAVSGNYIYLEEPLTFIHTKGSVGIERITYLADEKDGNPHIDATTKELKFGVEHTIFGHTALPFSIEQSFRQTDATLAWNSCYASIRVVKSRTLQFRLIPRAS